ncbi:MAG: hypothetical protein KIT81_01270 [Alphaproteobacteria bacterium]|nr:hypothetical protein [Alphaproteobacteria bacterium]
MADIHEIAGRHLAAALAEAGRAGLAEDLLGRAMLGQVIRLYRRHRTASDIAHELEFAARNLDDDEDYAFMRP